MTAPVIGTVYVRKHNRWWPLGPTVPPEPPTTPTGVQSVEIDLHFPAPGALTGLTADVHDLGIARRMYHQMSGIRSTRVKASISGADAGAAQLEAFYVDANGDDQFLGSSLTVANGVLRGVPVELPADAEADVVVGVRLNTGDSFGGDLTIERLSIGIFGGDGPDDEGPPPPACEIFPQDPSDILGVAAETDTQNLVTFAVGVHPDGGGESIEMTVDEFATGDATVTLTWIVPGLVPGGSYYVVAELWLVNNGSPGDFDLSPEVRSPGAVGPLVADAEGDLAAVFGFGFNGSGGAMVPPGIIHIDNINVLSAPCLVDPTPGGGGGGPAGDEEVPPPTPVVGDNPFGMASLPASGGGVFNSTIRPIRLSDVEDQLNVASGAGMKLFVLPGGPQGVHNPGGQFNLTAYLNNIDAMANDSAANSAIEDAIADGTIFAMYLLDEPTLVSRYGRVVTVAELTQIAQAVNDAWPGVRMVIRARPSAQASMITATSPTNAVGYWLAYAARKGSVTTMLSQDVTASAGRLLVVGMNVIDFHNLSGGSASATDLITYGTPLAQHAYPLAFSCWEYRASYYNGPGIAQAFEDLGNMFQAAHP